MILRNSHTPPAYTYISMTDLNHDDKILNKLAKYFGDDRSKWPVALLKSVVTEETRDPMTLTALGMAITYLE